MENDIPQSKMIFQDNKKVSRLVFIINMYLQEKEFSTAEAFSETSPAPEAAMNWAKAAAIANEQGKATEEAEAKARKELEEAKEAERLAEKEA